VLTILDELQVAHPEPPHPIPLDSNEGSNTCLGLFALLLQCGSPRAQVLLNAELELHQDRLERQSETASGDSLI
jgi:hypothetical protein